MKKPFLAAGAVTLCALSLGSATMASATPAPTATSSLKPVITQAAGALAEYHTYTDENGVDFQAGLSETADRTGSFIVEVPSSLTRTERVTFRIVGGRDLCETRAPMPREDGSETLLSCKATMPLDYGDTHVEAVLSTRDGEIVSDTVEVQAFLPDPSISFEHDVGNDLGHVNLTGLPGADYWVNAGDKLFKGVIPASGRWTIDVSHPDRGTWYAVNETYRHIGASATTWVENTDPVAAPEVTSVSSEGVRVRLVVETIEAGLVQVRNARGILVAGVSSTGDRTEIEFQGPADVEAHYSVSTLAHDVESISVPFVTNEGLGQATPDAPGLEKVDVSGSRPVATLHAEPGAIVTVVDESGKRVAVKRVGASASVEVPLPGTSSGTRALTTYEARQSTSTADSPATRLTIPGL